MAAALRFPADPALRRQLWRQWVHLDPPRGDKPVTPIRVVRKPHPAKIQSTNIEPAMGDALDATPGVVEGLRSAIEAALVDGQLSLADRHRFISRGIRLGLSRFDASLVVASVQHKALEAGGFRVIRQWTQPPVKRSRSVAMLVSTLLGLEALAVAGLAVWLRS